MFELDKSIKAVTRCIMNKRFNTTGTCIKSKHYVVNIDEVLILKKLKQC